MKDIARLEATSASMNTSARLYAPVAAMGLHGPSSTKVPEQNDRVSVSAVAQSLNVRAMEPKEGVSASRMVSLQDQILADSLKIDIDGIADHMLRDMSRE